MIESLSVATKLKQQCCVLYTVTNETIENIDSIVHFCSEHKVNVYMHPCFSYFGNTKLAAECVARMKRYFWHPYVRMSLPDLDFYVRGGNDIKHPNCKVGKSTIDISPDDCLTIPCFHKHTHKVEIDCHLFSLYQSSKWKTLFEKAGTYEFCNHCTIDCYFGMSYWDKLDHYFFKQNATFLKNWIEERRPY